MSNQFIFLDPHKCLKCFDIDWAYDFPPAFHKDRMSYTYAVHKSPTVKTINSWLDMCQAMYTA